MNRVKIYLINLDNRPDRLTNVLKRVCDLQVKIFRVSAVTGEEVKKLGVPYYALENNVANWYSHMKVLSIFLETEDEYCIVLEDDVLFSSDGLRLLDRIVNNSISEIDILQFGYVAVNGKLDIGKRDSVFRTLAKFRRISEVFVLELLNKTKSFHSFKHRLSRKEKILGIFRLNEERLGIKSLIVEGFEAGTHCYMINRRAAKALLKYNTPMLMVADLSLIVLSAAKNLLIARTTLSYATQDDSPVSTGEHSRYRFDLGSVISA
jgi:GR25 family glycosyltransferase involved in LPS biosynthesis